MTLIVMLLFYGVGVVRQFTANQIFWKKKKSVFPQEYSGVVLYTVTYTRQKENGKIRRGSSTHSFDQPFSFFSFSTLPSFCRACRRPPTLLPWRCLFHASGQLWGRPWNALGAPLSWCCPVWPACCATGATFSWSSACPAPSSSSTSGEAVRPCV